MSNSIVFVGGFGASAHYSKKMCEALQNFSCRKVYNIPLHHGYTLAEECAYVLEQIKDDVSPSFILMGFSTGCLIAMTLTKHVQTEQVILCNPAEVLTRLNLTAVKSMVDERSLVEHRNIATYKPIWERFSANNYSVSLWKGVLWTAGWIWWGGKMLLGPSRLAKLYYHYVAQHVNEPRADELERLLFQQEKIGHLLTTLVECILKPSLFHMLREYRGRVHIVEGLEDLLYVPYVKLLFYQNKSVTWHRTCGDHHMIYHHPITTAQKISTLIRVKTPYV